MSRLVSLAVIALSCSEAGPIHDTVDGSVPHDARHIDASNDTPDAALDAPMTDASLPCKPPNIIHGDGHHNPGMDCLGGCHDHGFSVAGTVMLADGVSPAVNATVTVIDATGNPQDLIVGDNGNFFSYFPVLYPITIRASMCPSTQFMVSQPTTGGCNATGCHEPGGVQGPAHL